LAECARAALQVLSDEDLEALLGQSLYDGEHDTWELESLQIQSSSQGMRVTATATVALRDVETGAETMQAAIGIGPVDAAFKAILNIVDRPIKLTNYNINKVSGGMQSAGNESLASVALHIREEDGALPPGALPTEETKDFPGHQGLTVGKDGVARSAPTITYSGSSTSTGDGRAPNPRPAPGPAPAPRPAPRLAERTPRPQTLSMPRRSRT